jgi:hypothetical protein
MVELAARHEPHEVNRMGSGYAMDFERMCRGAPKDGVRKRCRKWRGFGLRRRDDAAGGLSTQRT